MTEQTAAVVSVGGKQFVVSVGDVIQAATMDAKEGDVVELTDMTSPRSVKAVVVKHGRHAKVSGRLFRNKVRGSRYPHGHRQGFTELKIDAIK